MVSVQQQITMEYIGALQMYRLMETLLKENGEIVELIAWEILVNTTIYIETYAISSYFLQHTLNSKLFLNIFLN